jgi:hypothetical protein
MADLLGRARSSWPSGSFAKNLADYLAHSCLDLGSEEPAIFVAAQAMSNGRTILALLIALAVALLPAAGGAGVNVQSPAPADTSVMEGMPDCCPPTANLCEKAMDDCATMATCALKCFSFVGTSSTVVFPSTFATMTASFAAKPLSSQTGSPPFRPPRA